MELSAEHRRTAEQHTSKLLEGIIENQAAAECSVQNWCEMSGLEEVNTDVWFSLAYKTKGW
jgi:hypothetical protein